MQGRIRQISLGWEKKLGFEVALREGGTVAAGEVEYIAVPTSGVGISL